MLSIIIFIIGCIVTITTSLIFINSMSYWLVLCVSVIAILGMMTINGVVAIICSKLIPNKYFAGDKKFYLPSTKECKFYEKLGIKKWKDLNIDLGRLNGFKKDKIENTPEYIERFILENKKGYLTHYVSAIVSVVAIFILPVKFWVPMGFPIAITSLILNIIPAMILRYNMPRLKIMLKFSLRNKEKQ